MKSIRNLIYALSFLMGVWVFSSFVGVMFNVSNAEFWTTSLMWGLLASIFVMPALVFVLHAANRSERRAAQRQKQQAAPPVKEQPPFISEEAQEAPLWPEPETVWPEPETDSSSESHQGEEEGRNRSERL